MTGPGEGKLKLEAKVYLDEKKLAASGVYIHLKGYSRARVTHLDIESGELNNLIEGKGEYLKIVGIGEGILIEMPQGARVEKIKVIGANLDEVLPRGEEIYTWVGSKSRGIFIGFKKKQIKKLELLAEKKFGMGPI